LIENLQRNDLEPKETAQALSMLLGTFSTRELAKKIGKSKSYVSEMVETVQLLDTLEKHGMKVAYYPSEEKQNTGKAIPCSTCDLGCS